MYSLEFALSLANYIYLSILLKASPGQRDAGLFLYLIKRKNSGERSVKHEGSSVADTPALGGCRSRGWDLPVDVGSPPDKVCPCRLLVLPDQFLSGRDWEVGPRQVPSPHKRPYLVVGSSRIPGNGKTWGLISFPFFNLFGFLELGEKCVLLPRSCC